MTSLTPDFHFADTVTSGCPAAGVVFSLAVAALSLAVFVDAGASAFTPPNDHPAALEKVQIKVCL
ncbi:MAG: hypothetical protein VX002_01750, partial [Bacteroidota bacterium]|nr:hypothetical protein [Bacteroidota bacterium]